MGYILVKWPPQRDIKVVVSSACLLLQYLTRLVHTILSSFFLPDLVNLFCSCETFLFWQINGWLLLLALQQRKTRNGGLCMVSVSNDTHTTHNSLICCGE